MQVVFATPLQTWYDGSFLTARYVGDLRGVCIGTLLLDELDFSPTRAGSDRSSSDFPPALICPLAPLRVRLPPRLALAQIAQAQISYQRPLV